MLLHDSKWLQRCAITKRHLKTRTRQILSNLQILLLLLIMAKVIFYNVVYNASWPE